MDLEIQHEYHTILFNLIIISEYVPGSMFLQLIFFSLQDNYFLRDLRVV